MPWRELLRMHRGNDPFNEPPSLIARSKTVVGPGPPDQHSRWIGLRQKNRVGYRDDLVLLAVNHRPRNRDAGRCSENLVTPRVGEKIFTYSWIGAPGRSWRVGKCSRGRDGHERA